MEKSNRTNRIVVGIDFGTAGIGYAFDFQGGNPRSIILSDFPGQSADHKVPSEIILDNYLEDVLAFGEECNSYITPSDRDKSSYEYFKNIKMNLYEGIYRIKSTNGKEANIELVISKLLKKVAENAISQIERSTISFKREEIKWVVTIPAIWDEKSKDIMINASIKAGLIGENDDKSLFLALEPEAAGIYYYLSFLHDKKTYDKLIQDNTPYIVCDIGAGTVDLCTQKRIVNHNETAELIEEYPPIGGDYGGKKINKEFINRLIVEIFGEEKVKNIQTNSNKSKRWIQFEKDIEEIKIACCQNENCNLTLNCYLFKDNSEKTLDDYIGDYNKKQIRYKYEIKRQDEWELEFPSQIFYDIIKELSKQIFLKIEEIYNNVHTRYILLTGAGSKNHVITHYLYDFAKEKNISLNIVTPSNPEISIIKGAVLYGFQRNIIRKRKAKYTLGIGISRKWDDKYQGRGEKIYNELEKEYKCNNLFSKFITINQYINFDDVITQNYYALDKNQPITFYKTTKINCTYKDEKDENGQLVIHKFGDVTFHICEDFDVNDRRITIQMKLGGTYIDACAIYEKTGRRLNIVKSFY